MPLIGHRLPLLLAPVLASPGVLPAPAGPHEAWIDLRTPSYVCQDIENKVCAKQDKCSARSPQLAKAPPMPPGTAYRRHPALDTYLAEEKIEAICRHLTCSKSWLYTWRNRSDATNPAWVQERSTRPTHSPTHTPDHGAQAIVSLYKTLHHNGTGGSATAIIRALTQYGIAPVPSRRTIDRIIRRHHTEVK
jgi:hypothetical protein